MNPIILQKQLKENANDLQNFCKDLQSWGEEMKRKENSLKNIEDNNLKKSKVQSSGRVKSKTKELQKSKHSIVGSTDYAKWEKYDADLECEHLEDDLKDDSELTDEFEDSVRDDAIVYKEKGNSHVKTQDWDKAIESYTKAIKCYSYDPVFYANRGLCYLKKQNFAAAEEDCTISLKLDGTYVKALQRRGAARENLGKLDLAINDLEKVLALEPKNKESIAALEKMKKKIGHFKKEIEDQQRPVSKFTASRNKTQPSKPLISSTTLKTEIIQKTVLQTAKIDTSLPSTSRWPDPGCEIIPCKPIDKPPHLRSKKPLKRVTIAEADNLNETSENIQVKDSNAVKKNVVENVKKVTFQDDDNANEPFEITSAFKKKRSQVKSEVNEQLTTTAWPKPNTKNENIRSDNLLVFEKTKLAESTLKDVKNTENLFITKMDNKVVKDVKSQKSKAQEFNEFSVPKTCVQFNATWKSLKTPEEKYKYLKLIDPNEILNLFQESLESNVFSDILDVLSTQFIENGETVYKFLCGLTEVKRFSTLTMFMDPRDKNCLWKIITYLRDQEKSPKEDVDKLILKYEL